MPESLQTFYLYDNPLATEDLHALAERTQLVEIYHENISQETIQLLKDRKLLHKTNRRRRLALAAALKVKEEVLYELLQRV